MKKLVLYGLLGLAMMAGCGRNQEKSADALAKVAQHALDSLKTTKYFTDRDIRSYLQEEFEKFYQNRSYRLAWVTEAGVQSQATELLDALNKSTQEGLYPEDYHVEEMQAMQKQLFQEKAFKGKESKAQLVNLDFLMTANYLMYASHLLSGRIDPEKLNQEWKFIPRKRDLAARLENAISQNEVEQSLLGLLPPDKSYPVMKEKLTQYRKVAAAGGWPMIPAGQKLRKGSGGAAVAALKRRLMLSGDLDSAGLNRTAQASMVSLPASVGTNAFDDQVEAAVKNFQNRLGIAPTGQVDAATLAALNVPVKQRVQQIALNMERMRWQPDTLKGLQYVVVNVPEFKLRVVEDDKTDMEMRVIVGEEFTSTPIFSDSIEYLVLSPTWTVPTSIIQNELYTKLQNNPDYLTSNDLQLYKTWSESDTIPMDPTQINWDSIPSDKFPYRLVQKPGPRNPLGLVKFAMPNNMAIYLHDTPADHLFAKEQRGLSHGCIRLEKPLELAKLLLQNNRTEIEPDSLNVWMHQGHPKIVKLDKKVPVRIAYLTAWVDERGQLNFRDDIYEYDKMQLNAISRKEKTL